MPGQKPKFSQRRDLLLPSKVRFHLTPTLSPLSPSFCSIIRHRNLSPRVGTERSMLTGTWWRNLYHCLLRHLLIWLLTTRRMHTAFGYHLPGSGFSDRYWRLDRFLWPEPHAASPSCSRTVTSPDNDRHSPMMWPNPVPKRQLGTGGSHTGRCGKTFHTTAEHVVQLAVECEDGMGCRRRHDTKS
jgi:hypothetical protein